MSYEDVGEGERERKRERCVYLRVCVSCWGRGARGWEAFSSSLALSYTFPGRRLSRATRGSSGRQRHQRLRRQISPPISSIGVAEILANALVQGSHSIQPTRAHTQTIHTTIAASSHVRRSPESKEDDQLVGKAFGMAAHPSFLLPTATRFHFWLRFCRVTALFTTPTPQLVRDLSALTFHSDHH